MVTRSAADIRREFLEFFRQREHAVVPGSPVVPYDDPTLLFTNAGMNQFKDVFLGTGSRPYKRAANTQPCIRAGGKHNDLDDVGRDTYHHTFFEMLGNWSFGDYFKREAIAWAWELLTDVWGLDKTRLHATYFEGDEAEGLEPDLEAKELWASVTDIDPSYIHPGNKKDNFWEMGDVGPCGPCSEIHIDLTPDKSGTKLVNAGDARVIEIWNLVFIQFNRTAGGKLTPLPARHVDTGMGFERVTALLQGKSSNYDTDIFTPIFDAIRTVAGAPPYRGTLPSSSVAPVSNRCEQTGLKDHRLQTGATAEQLMLDVSYRVIADHIRCLTFALNDGAVPDREGRGYVLRRILRRAYWHGWQYMNMREPFLYKLVPAVVDSLGDAFPQLKDKPDQVAEILREEEEAFYKTLGRGMSLFALGAIDAIARSARQYLGWELGTSVAYFPETAGISTLPFRTPHGEQDVSVHDVLARLPAPPAISGQDAFKLHDTYGFPIDLTHIMAEEKGLTVDNGEYQRLMEEAREQARARGDTVADEFTELARRAAEQAEQPTEDLPKYADELQCDSFLTSLARNAPPGDTDSAKCGQSVAFSVAETPFYTEAGGQVSDVGRVTTDTGEIQVTKVVKHTVTPRSGGEAFTVVVHCGKVVRGEIRPGSQCRITASGERRIPTMKNHTATHVINWALRQVLGEHVQQRGSLVDPDKTRFDFSHPRPLTPAEIERVETLVNERIRENLPVHAEFKPLAEAQRITGLRAVFGEKYPDPVRVVACGVAIDELLANPDNPEWRRYPIEFCGGTHVKRTGEIEHFAIISEEAVAKGIRRVVGITGPAARRAIDDATDLLKRAESLRSAGPPSPPCARSAGPPSPASPEDFATRLAQLQQAVARATLRVADRAKLRAAIADLQHILKKQQKVQAARALDVVNARIDELLKDAPRIGETTVVVAEMPDAPLEQLKSGADRIKQKCKSAVVLFGVWVGRASSPPAEPEAQARDKPTAGKALLLAAMTPDLVKKGLKAGDLVKHIAPLVQGGGGGPATMAQAGGKNPAKLADALESGRGWIADKLPH